LILRRALEKRIGLNACQELLLSRGFSDFLG